jgi:hypothetical protein
MEQEFQTKVSATVMNLTENCMSNEERKEGKELAEALQRLPKLLYGCQSHYNAYQQVITVPKVNYPKLVITI